FAILHDFTLYRQAVNRPDLHAVATDLGDVALFQVHEAVSDLAQGHLVGGEEVFSKTQTDHQWATTAGRHQTIRLFRADHGQTVSTVQFLDCRFQGDG